MSTPKQQLLDAVAAHRRGEFDKAEAAYRAILRAQPNHFDATHLLGAALCARGRNKEAETFLRRAVALNPKVAAAQNNLGNAVMALGRTDESLACYDRAIALDPKYADALVNRGNVHLERSRFVEALADYDRVLVLNPNAVNALQKSAKALTELGRHEDALVRNDRALALEANSVEAWVRSGNILIHLRRPQDALNSYDRALAIDPGYTDALVNRSAALDGLGRSAEALAGLDRVLTAKPDEAGALNNKATILKSLGRLDETCAHFGKALVVKPDDADTRTNYAMTLLLNGDFAAGWPEYEARWRKKANTGKRPAPIQPEWNGEPLDGRSIVVFAEQGLGDIVQFARYLPLLRARGADVALLVTARMHALLRAAFPQVTFVAEIADARKFDFQCAMMSMPRCFGTRVDTIPVSGPYLRPDPQKVALGRERIGTQGFKVGICWQGNPDVAIDIGRSIPLAAFAPLASVPGVRLVSLQKNAGVEQLERAAFAVETLGGISIPAATLSSTRWR